MNAWNAAAAEGFQLATQGPDALNTDASPAEYESSTSSSAAYAAAYAQQQQQPQQCGGANQLSPIVHDPVYPESAPSTTSAHPGIYGGGYGGGANELSAAAGSQYDQLLFTSALQAQIASQQANADALSQFAMSQFHQMAMAMGAPSVPGWEGGQQASSAASSNLLDQAVAQSAAGADYFAAPQQQIDSLINQYQYAATMNAGLGNLQQQNYAVRASAGPPQLEQGNLQQQQQLTNPFLNSNASDAATGVFDALNSSGTYAQTQQDPSAIGNTCAQTMMLGLATLPVQENHREDPGWEAQFRVLSKWRMEKGHCKIPARCQENPRLGRWVMTQRRQYVLLRDGKPSAMTQSRIDRLNNIDFCWSIRPEPQTSWVNKYEQLQDFFHKMGHCIVPQRYEKNPQLGTWVHTQRRQYKLRLDGRKSSMTQDKINLLNNINFEWDGNRKKGLNQR